MGNWLQDNRPDLSKTLMHSKKKNFNKKLLAWLPRNLFVCSFFAQSVDKNWLFSLWTKMLFKTSSEMVDKNVLC